MVVTTPIMEKIRPAQTVNIEKVPTPPPGGGATLLKYGEEVQVPRSTSMKTFAITRSWKKATIFTTPTERVFKMHISKSPEFQPEDTIASYQFTKTADGHELALFAKEMEALWQLTTLNYLYIRFECVENTTLKPSYWHPNECAINTPRLEPDSVRFRPERKVYTVYSFLYDDWKGGDWIFDWKGQTQTCWVFLGDTCAEIDGANKPHVFASKEIAKSTQWGIKAEDVDTMAKYVDEDGYLYVCFYANQRADVDFITRAPSEVDPPCYTKEIVDDIIACDEYEWRGKKYTVSGTYEESSNDSWCPDFIYKLNLTINHSSTGKVIAEQRVSYISDLGNIYTESGEYTEVTTNVAGCDSIITLLLTILKVDTARFCSGFNYEHEEIHSGNVIIYKPYLYESPAEWDYMDGVELQHDGARTLMDLHKAEENLYEHYTGSLTPITAISWSHRPEGKKPYEPITVKDEPQWIEAGSLALRLQFLCGETYSTSYVTDIDNVDADATPVKRIENGRVIILRGGVRYDMLGNVIK